ncbi:MAG: hypothetical protein MRZ49_07790 [Lachnospiraceae bacterium]|nr:hypothetical protein [Lachnospiraceae bacterium]
MYQYSAIQWLFFFYFYCFCGWCFESAYVSIRRRKLTNRGFMRGPFLPIYGSGAIMMLVVSMPFQDNVVLTYLAGCVGATALEYVTGVAMEALFKVRYWDYSNQKFNFQGHICLSSTLVWGAFTVVLTRFIHVPVERMVLAIPSKVLTVVTLILTAVIFSDFALSFKAAIDLRNVLDKMERAKEELSHIQKRLNTLIEQKEEEMASRKEAFTENLREELAELKAKSNFLQERRNHATGLLDVFQKNMIRSNPGMTSVKYKESLEELKEKLEKLKNKNNKNNE